jgi:hypothetical protein
LETLADKSASCDCMSYSLDFRVKTVSSKSGASKPPYPRGS